MNLKIIEHRGACRGRPPTTRGPTRDGPVGSWQLAVGSDQLTANYPGTRELFWSLKECDALAMRHRRGEPTPVHRRRCKYRVLYRELQLVNSSFRTQDSGFSRARDWVWYTCSENPMNEMNRHNDMIPPPGRTPAKRGRMGEVCPGGNVEREMLYVKCYM